MTARARRGVRRRTVGTAVLGTAAVGKVVAVLATAGLLSGCFFVSESDRGRLDAPPDTALRQSPGPPTAGLLAGGGTYRLELQRWDAAFCEQKPVEDPADFFQNLFTPDTTPGENVDLTDDDRAELAEFLGALSLRVAKPDPAIVSRGGTTAVVGFGLDPSGSLPWTGKATGGASQRFQASSFIVGFNDRRVEVVVSVPAATADAVNDAADGKIDLTWKESSTQPLWVGNTGDSTSSCQANGIVRLVRTGGPLAGDVTPPTGDARTVEVSPRPAAGTPLDAALSLVTRSTWQDLGEGRLALVEAGGEATALGNWIVSGDTLVFQLTSARDSAPFSYRGFKTADGRVRGTLSADGAEAYVVLTG